MSVLDAELCKACPKPGLCCSGFPLIGSRWPDGVNVETALEALVILATAYHPDPWMFDTGLPFLPKERTEDGSWRFTCPRLDSAGRCGDYENRPALCRSFEPGRDTPCAMTIPARSLPSWYLEEMLQKKLAEQKDDENCE